MIKIKNNDDNGSLIIQISDGISSSHIDDSSNYFEEHSTNSGLVDSKNSAFIQSKIFETPVKGGKRSNISYSEIKGKSMSMLTCSISQHNG